MSSVPAGLVLALTTVLVGKLADHQPTHLLVSMGLTLLALSLALMMTVTLSSAVWVLVLWPIVGRVGLGFILPSLNQGALRPLEKGLLSLGSSASISCACSVATLASVCVASCSSGACLRMVSP